MINHEFLVTYIYILGKSILELTSVKIDSCSLQSQLKSCARTAWLPASLLVSFMSRPHPRRHMQGGHETKSCTRALKLSTQDYVILLIAVLVLALCPACLIIHN